MYNPPHRVLGLKNLGPTQRLEIIMSKIIHAFFVVGFAVLLLAISVPMAEDAINSQATQFGNKLGSTPISEMIDKAPKSNPFD